MSNFTRLLSQVSSELKEVVPDRSLLDAVTQGFTDRGFDREPPQRQLGVFTALVWGDSDPPTPRNERKGLYESSLELARQHGGAFRPCEGRDSNNRPIATHDRHSQAISMKTMCDGACCPSFLTAKTVSSMARSRIGRGSPLRLPRVQDLTAGYVPSWDEESPALTQVLAGQMVCFAMPATSDRCSHLDMENATRTGILYPADRVCLCKVCNTLVTWVKAKDQPQVDVLRPLAAWEIDSFERQFAAHATPKSANANNAHRDELRRYLTANKSVQAYPLCFVDIKLPSFETSDLTAYDFVSAERSERLPRLFGELCAYLNQHCSSVDTDQRRSQTKVGAFFHPLVGRLTVFVRQKNCPFTSHLVECTCPWVPALSDILRRLVTERKRAFNPILTASLLPKAPSTTVSAPKPRIPVSEEQSETRSASAQEVLPPLPTRLTAVRRDSVPPLSAHSTAVQRDSVPLAAVLRPPPPPPRPVVPMVTSQTSSTPPPIPRPFPPRPVKSTQPMVSPLPASPSPLSPAPPPPPRQELTMPSPEIMYEIFGEDGLVSRYLALQRSEERSALLTEEEEERPQHEASLRRVDQRPRPPRPQFRAPDWISPKGTPWWSPAVPKFVLTRPLGFAAVLTDQLVAEDWEDLFGDAHPSGEEVLEMQVQEAEEMSFYSPLSDRGGYYVAQPLSTGTALYFAAVGTLPGPSFTPRTCQWSVFLDPFHDEDYSWIDMVIVDSLPTAVADDDWRQAVLRRWRSFWDISDDVIPDHCLDYIRGAEMLPLCGYAIAGFMSSPDRWCEDDLAGRVLLLSGLAVGKTTSWSSDRDYVGYVPAAYEVLDWLQLGGIYAQAVLIHTEGHELRDEEASYVLKHEANVVFCCREHCEQAIYLINRLAHIRPLVSLDRTVYCYRSFRAFHASAPGWDGKPSGLTAEELVAVALLETGLHGLQAQRERQLPPSLFDRVAHEVRYFGWSTQAEIDRVRRPNQLPAYFHHSVRTGAIDPDRLLEDLVRFYRVPSAARLGRPSERTMSITEVVEEDSN